MPRQVAWPQPGRITTPEPFPGPHPWADVMYYGAQGDGVTDDSGAFQLAVTAAANNGVGAGGSGGYVLLGAYSFKVGASLTVPANVTFLSFGAVISGVGAATVTPVLSYGTPGTPQLTGPLDLAVRSVTVSATSPYAPVLPHNAAVTTPGGIQTGLFWDSGGQVANVKTWGVKGDGQTILDGVMNGSTAVLTSVTGKFVAADVGKLCVVPGAGAAGIALSTTIASYQSATQVTLAANSATAVATAAAFWATDDTTNLQAAITALSTSSTFSELLIPTGFYGLSTFLSLPVSLYGTRIRGAGWGQVSTLFGGTCLVQCANNVPVLKTAGENMSAVSIEEITLCFAARQPAANTAAMGLMFSIPIAGVSFGWYKWVLSHIFFFNCAVGMGFDPAGTGLYAFWGNRCRDLRFEDTSISAISFISPTTSGAEASLYDCITILNSNAPKVIPAGPAVVIATAESFFINLIIEDWSPASTPSATLVYFYGGGPTHIWGLHVERCLLANGQSMIQNGATLTVENATFTATMAPGVGNTGYIFRQVTGGRTHLEKITTAITQTNGTTVFLISADATNKVWLRDYLDRGPNAPVFLAAGYDAITPKQVLQYDNTFYAPGLGYKGDLQRSSQFPAFVTPYTPDPTFGELIKMGALTGAITVNLPAAPVTGQHMRFYWVQDGVGGRVVTYNVAYKAGGVAAFVTTLSTITIDEFEFDGGNWRILSRATGQAI